MDIFKLRQMRGLKLQERSGEPCLQVGEATLTREGSVSGGSAKTPFKTSGSWSCCDWSGRADVLLQVFELTLSIKILKFKILSNSSI